MENRPIFFVLLLLLFGTFIVYIGYIQNNTPKKKVRKAKFSGKYGDWLTNSKVGIKINKLEVKTDSDLDGTSSEDLQTLEMNYKITNFSSSSVKFNKIEIEFQIPTTENANGEFATCTYITGTKTNDGCENYYGLMSPPEIKEKKLKSFSLKPGEKIELQAYSSDIGLFIGKYRILIKLCSDEKVIHGPFKADVSVSLNNKKNKYVFK